MPALASKGVAETLAGVAERSAGVSVAATTTRARPCSATKGGEGPTWFRPQRGFRASVHAGPIDLGAKGWGFGYRRRQSAWTVAAAAERG